MYKLRSHSSDWSVLVLNWILTNQMYKIGVCAQKKNYNLVGPRDHFIGAVVILLNRGWADSYKEMLLDDF